MDTTDDDEDIGGSNLWTVLVGALIIGVLGKDICRRVVVIAG